MHLLSRRDKLMWISPEGNLLTLTHTHVALRPGHIRTFVLLLEALTMFRCIPLLTQSLCGWFGGLCPVPVRSHVHCVRRAHVCISMLWRHKINMHAHVMTARALQVSRSHKLGLGWSHFKVLVVVFSIRGASHQRVFGVVVCCSKRSWRSDL